MLQCRGGPRMNPQLPPLNPLRVFESAARHLSFTRAAQELHITQGAVSHQVKALEAWLGFSLFERRARQLQLTRGGALYAAALSGAFAQTVRATQEIGRASGRERVCQYG